MPNSARPLAPAALSTPHPTTMPAGPDHKPQMPVSVLLACTHGLIMRYQHNRSRTVARSLACLYDELARHPDLASSNESPCEYRRLASHWNWLAVQSPTTDSREQDHVSEARI